MEKIFDLFKLYVPKEDSGARSYIRVFGEKLFDNVRIIINDILSINNEKITYLSKRIAKRLGINYDTVLKMLRGKNNEWIALPVLIELLNEWKIKCNKSEKEIINKRSNLQSYFEKLKSNSRIKNEVNVVKNLDITLAKIIGAHMADGCLSKIKTFGGYRYRITIVDEYKSNLESFSRWVKEVFGINVKINKARSNAWEIILNNKIIGRYLEIFLGFPAGMKTYLNLPQIINKSSKTIKRAFIIGLFSFDGCVETGRIVSYGIANEILRDQVVDILKGFNLQIIPQNKGGCYHLKTSVLNKKGLKMWINFFEKNTEKWFKLKDFIRGFNKKVSSFDEAIFILDKIYKNGLKTNIPKIVSILKNLKVCDKYVLANRLKIGVSTLYRYIHILEEANILIRTKTPCNNIDINLSNFHNKYVRLIIIKDFINGLFKQLKLKGYSRKDLALKLGVCESTTNNWARYRSNIPLDKLNKLLNLANIRFKNNAIIGFNRFVFIYNPYVKEWRVPYRPY